MNFNCLDLRGQIFTHIDPQTGVNTVFAATEIRRWCDQNILPLVMIPITRRDAEMIVQYRGIEADRLFRARATKRWLPLLLVHMPDATHLLIDGSHTYVARASLGHRWALAYLVPQEIWTYFTVEGLPQATEDQLANSWSGVI